MGSIAEQTACEALPALDFLKLMFLSREGDRREGILLRQGKGWFQVSAMGHESLAALAYHLLPEDCLYVYYRDRPLVLARGIGNRDLALAYFARQASSSGGRQMPGHYSSRSLNIFSVATPTGSQCLPAAGGAWAFRLSGAPHVALCTIGDAATREGEFYEAVAFALQEKLPVVFVVEDNGYGISTPTACMAPYRIGALNPNHVVYVNGRDPFAVFELGGAAIRRARAGEGPTVLWCELDRLCSHTSSDDHRMYRSREELEAIAQRDPIEVLAKRLINEGQLSADEWGRVQSDIVRQVDLDYQAAEQAAAPDPTEVADCLYAPELSAGPPPISADEPVTMVTAVNQTLRAGLDAHERMILFGEDIEDPRGGVFGLTRGLSRDFPARVHNSPLAEATIFGVGVGMAALGYKPVFELQFIDFIGPAMNQLVSQAASLRWRSMGDWTCPLVILAPYGAYLPGGSLWHSQSNEGMLAHIPGIQIAVPSTPQDAAGLLWSAIQGNNPTMLLLPKHLFRKKAPLPHPLPATPFGKAAIRREGKDVTLVSWGNCVEIALDAALEIEEDGFSTEVIDLRSLVPCDWKTIEKSLAKTGRLVVVHEDSRTTGFGQAILAEMTSKPERWNLFLAPPQLVARPDVHVPFNPTLEYAVLPSVRQVAEAIRLTLE